MDKIVITGAASGLGAALAKQYAANGWAVCIADIQAQEGRKLAEQLASDYDQDCFFHPLDVTSDEQWVELQNTIASRWQRLDCIINNAGVASSGGIDDQPMKDFQWTLEVNTMGVAKGCHYFTPILKKTGGHIVNVASMAGLIHMPTMSAYNASKAAVVALSETLSSELDSYGIRVSVVCPAFFQTNLTKTMRSSNSLGTQFASKAMEASNITADDIAAQVYKQSLAGKFLILTHPRETNIWRIKRYLPFLYMRKMKEVGKSIKTRLS